MLHSSCTPNVLIRFIITKDIITLNVVEHLSSGELIRDQEKEDQRVKKTEIILNYDHRMIVLESFQHTALSGS